MWGTESGGEHGFLIIIIILNYYSPLSSAHLPLPSSTHGLGPIQNFWLDCVKPGALLAGPCPSPFLVLASQLCQHQEGEIHLQIPQVVLASFLLVGTKAKSDVRVVGLWEEERT